MGLKEVARFLGVHQNTVRRWGKRGFLVPKRNPMNNWRRYLREDIEQFLKDLNDPDSSYDFYNKKKIRKSIKILDKLQ